MNRLLSILVSLFILFLVYLWINHITTDPWSTDEPDTFSISGQEETARTPYPEDTKVEETAGAESAIAEDNASSEPEGHNAQPAGEESSPDPSPATSESQESPNVKSTPAKPTNDLGLRPEQQHLVIAGNFLERSNAEKRVRELQAYGFSNAEVVNFQLSEYHTACAGRYGNLDEAQRIARKLKDSHHIDAYVRHGN